MDESPEFGEAPETESQPPRPDPDRGEKRLGKSGNSLLAVVFFFLFVAIILWCILEWGEFVLRR